jgi:hypothetical protein
MNHSFQIQFRIKFKKKIEIIESPCQYKSLFFIDTTLFSIFFNSLVLTQSSLD